VPVTGRVGWKVKRGLALNGAALGYGRKGGGGSRLIAPKRVANTRETATGLCAKGVCGGSTKGNFIIYAKLVVKLR